MAEPMQGPSNPIMCPPLDTTRTIAEQVRICRADLERSLQMALEKIDVADEWTLGETDDKATEVFCLLDSALANANWLAELTRPNPEPVPAVATTALDRRLGVGPTDAEMTDAAFQEALVEVFGSDRGAD